MREEFDRLELASLVDGQKHLILALHFLHSVSLSAGEFVQASSYRTAIKIFFFKVISQITIKDFFFKK